MSVLPIGRIQYKNIANILCLLKVIDKRCLDLLHAPWTSVNRIGIKLEDKTPRDSNLRLSGPGECNFFCQLANRK